MARRKQQAVSGRHRMPFWANLRWRLRALLDTISGREGDDWHLDDDYVVDDSGRPARKVWTP